MSEDVTYLMDQVRLDADDRTFFGKSSQLMLIKTAMEMKKECVGENPPNLPLGSFKRPEFWIVPAVSFPYFH
jgi:hypothetical protein